MGRVWGLLKMKVKWGKVPLELTCPKCQDKLDKYEELSKSQWKFIIPKTPDPLQDYHKCPRCQRVWAILRSHTDETS